MRVALYPFAIQIGPGKNKRQTRPPITLINAKLDQENKRQTRPPITLKNIPD